MTSTITWTSQENKEKARHQKSPLDDELLHFIPLRGRRRLSLSLSSGLRCN